jgi:hypothetical protein
MKVILERTLASCPEELICAACRQTFFVSDIRTLICRDNGWIEGDLCSACVKLGQVEVQKNLHDRALLLMRQPTPGSGSGPSPQKQAFMLLEMAQESVRFPKFYQWWWKKLEIWFEEVQELENTQTQKAPSQGLPYF